MSSTTRRAPEQFAALAGYELGLACSHRGCQNVLQVPDGASFKPVRFTCPEHVGENEREDEMAEDKPEQERRNEALDEDAAPASARAAAAAAALNAAFPPTTEEGGVGTLPQLRARFCGDCGRPLILGERCRCMLLAPVCTGCGWVLKREDNDARCLNPNCRSNLVGEVTVTASAYARLQQRVVLLEARVETLQREMEQLTDPAKALEEKTALIAGIVRELSMALTVEGIFRKNPLMEKLRGEAEKPNSEPDRG